MRCEVLACGLLNCLLGPIPFSPCCQGRALLPCCYFKWSARCSRPVSFRASSSLLATHTRKFTRAHICHLQVDMIIVGSSVVDQNGCRLGKGEGGRSLHSLHCTAQWQACVRPFQLAGLLTHEERATQTASLKLAGLMSGASCGQSMLARQLC